MIRSGDCGANRAPSGAIPGIGKSAMSAPSRASPMLAACRTPGMPSCGHGKPCARTSAPAATAQRAISCSLRSPPTMAMTSWFQLIKAPYGAARRSPQGGASALGTARRRSLRPDEVDEFALGHAGDAHRLRGSPALAIVRSNERLGEREQRVGDWRGDAGDRGELDERQQAVTEVLT